MQGGRRVLHVLGPRLDEDARHVAHRLRGRSRLVLLMESTPCLDAVVLADGPDAVQGLSFSLVGEQGPEVGAEVEVVAARRASPTVAIAPDLGLELLLGDWLRLFRAPLEHRGDVAVSDRRQGQEVAHLEHPILEALLILPIEGIRAALLPVVELRRACPAAAVGIDVHSASGFACCLGWRPEVDRCPKTLHLSRQLVLDSRQLGMLCDHG